MRLLVYGDVGGSGGYVRYCKSLFGEGRVPGDIEVYFVCSPQLSEQLQPLDDKVRILSHSWPASASRMKRWFWHLWMYPRLVAKLRPQVEFYPLGQVRIPGRGTKIIVTCHNLLLFDREQLLRMKGRREQLRLEKNRSHQARSFQKAAKTIFLSDYSRMVVEQEVPDISDSTVISLGLDPAIRSEGKHSYSLGKKITLLYVSTILPYKNHEVLVRAVKKLRRETGLDLHLKLVGGANSTSLNDLLTVIGREQMGPYVEMVGELEDAPLALEYRNADMFAFPSSCECFPNVLIEAMGSGLPIACSDKVGLPEILRDAGVYFDPESLDSVVFALKELLADEKKRQLYGQRAHRYAREYTWERCAFETFSLIRQIGNNIR